MWMPEGAPAFDIERLLSGSAYDGLGSDCDRRQSGGGRLSAAHARLVNVDLGNFNPAFRGEPETTSNSGDTFRGVVAVLHR